MRGGETAAIVLSFVESAKLQHLNPYAYLNDVLTRLPSAKARDLDSLLPRLCSLADSPHPLNALVGAFLYGSDS